MSQDRVLFEQGLQLFRHFTPQSYLHATALFRRAVKIEPQNCLYKLHLSETLLFLALEQKLNRQNHQASWTEATSIVKQLSTASQTEGSTTSSRTFGDCSKYRASILRLEAISLLDEFQPGGDSTALAKIAHAIELEPADPIAWWVRWKLNPSTRRQNNAILEAAFLSNDLALIHYAVGNYWLIKTAYSKAKDSFERAIELSPNHFRSYIGLAQALSAADDTKDVEHLYRKATELAPSFIEGRILLGDYLVSLEETEAALKEYRTVLEQDPDYEIAHLRLGLTKLQSGDFEGSELSFERAIALNQASYQAYYYLGNVWLSRRKLGPSTRALRRIAQICIELSGSSVCPWDGSVPQRQLRYSLRALPTGIGARPPSR